MHSEDYYRPDLPPPPESYEDFPEVGYHPVLAIAAFLMAILVAIAAL